jgi:hypothetical protein
MIEEITDDCPFINKVWYSNEKEKLIVEIENDEEYYYIYRGVGNDIFDQFISSYQKGSFFNREIRDEYDTEEISKQRAITEVM